MSTIAPTVAVRVADALAQKGARCLDAPLSGGDVGTKEGTLSIMVAGDESVFQTIKPTPEVLGKTIGYCPNCRDLVRLPSARDGSCR